MTTAARVFTAASARWYTKSGEPFYEIANKSGGGMRAPTLADAKKLNLYPSVTTVLRMLDKPQLNDWKIEQACLAVLTSPRLKGEALDAFVHRILHVEAVQDEEARKARDTGSQIHDAIEQALHGRDWDKSLQAFVNPVLEWVKSTGHMMFTELVLVGRGYAGRMDAILETEFCDVNYVTDFKTTRTLPDKDSYLEHKLQTAAYAHALPPAIKKKKTATCNVYISTRTPGDIKVFSQDYEEWREAYEHGFHPLLEVWQWINHHIPV